MTVGEMVIWGVGILLLIQSFGGFFIWLIYLFRDLWLSMDKEYQMEQKLKRREEIRNYKKQLKKGKQV